MIKSFKSESQRKSKKSTKRNPILKYILLTLILHFHQFQHTHINTREFAKVPIICNNNLLEALEFFVREE